MRVFILFFISVFADEEIEVPHDEVMNTEPVDVDVAAIPPDTADLLSPHGRKWRVETTLEADISSHQPYQHGARFRWGESPGLDLRPLNERQPSDYFLFHFPKTLIVEMVRHTNVVIESSNYANYLKRPTTSKEIYQFLGILLAIVFTGNREGFAGFWKSDHNDSLPKTIGDFKADYGMSKNRFETILYCLRFGPRVPTPVEGEEVTDALFMIIGVIDSYFM